MSLNGCDKINLPKLFLIAISHKLAVLTKTSDDSIVCNAFLLNWLSFYKNKAKHAYQSNKPLHIILFFITKAL